MSEKNPSPPPRAGRLALDRVLVLLASLLVSVGGLELGVRALLGSRDLSNPVGLFTVRNFTTDRVDLLRSAYPASYDSRLGWIPTPGFSGVQNIWRTQVTIDDQGFRTHGREPLAGPVSVLVVGDSYAFGDQVDDGQTMPAQLERLLGEPVVNAAVFGYGLDQSVLRAERHLEELDPATVVLQFIADDIDRTALSVRTGVSKPYFDFEGPDLVLRNVPTSPDRPSLDDLGLWRRVLGYSYFLDWTMRRAGWSDWWYLGSWPSTRVHDDPQRSLEISCAMLERLRGKVEGRLVLLSLYGGAEIASGVELPTVPLMVCARELGIEVVDTHDAFTELWRRDPETFASLYVPPHFSEAGNRRVAELLAEELSARR